MPYGCLVRATDGKKKVSTLLGPKDVLRFQDAYDTILKVSGCRLRGKGATWIGAAEKESLVSQKLMWLPCISNFSRPRWTR